MKQKDLQHSRVLLEQVKYAKPIKAHIFALVEEKYKIPMQYETINVGGTTEHLHALSKKVDRYLLHIIEEVAEFLEEFDKIYTTDTTKTDYTNDESCLMELIDVIAYTVSLLSIFYIDLYGLDNVKSLTTKQDTNCIKFLSSFTANNLKDLVDEKLLDFEKILMLSVRRNFPERKWHKDTQRSLSITELANLYETCIDGVVEALCIALSLFLHLTNNNCELFNDMFLEKNEIIYSLKH